MSGSAGPQFDGYTQVLSREGLTGFQPTAEFQPVLGGKEEAVVYEPQPGDRFTFLGSFLAHPTGGSGFTGWFSNVDLGPAWPEKDQWMWEFVDYNTGLSYVAQEPTGPFWSATLLMIPEPGTLVLLLSGALALTVGWWQRRRVV